MTEVKCSVESCSYNKDGGCYINPIQIGGKGAVEDNLTCCGSFLNRQHYSNLAEYTSMRGAAEAVSCNVNTCRYNEHEECTRSDISVVGDRDVNVYTETKCNSFEKR